MPAIEEKPKRHDGVERQPNSGATSESVLDPSDIEACKAQVLESATTPAVPPPPDGGYGWVCVLACSLVNGFTWGVVSVSSSSSFITHYF